jgi:hypothetical protein
MKTVFHVLCFVMCVYVCVRARTRAKSWKLPCVQSMRTWFFYVNVKLVI